MQFVYIYFGKSDLKLSGDQGSGNRKWGSGFGDRGSGIRDRTFKGNILKNYSQGRWNILKKIDFSCKSSLLLKKRRSAGRAESVHILCAPYTICFDSTQMLQSMMERRKALALETFVWNDASESSKGGKF